jgi:hypothetical protein
VHRQTHRERGMPHNQSEHIRAQLDLSDVSERGAQKREKDKTRAEIGRERTERGERRAKRGE